MRRASYLAILILASFSLAACTESGPKNAAYWGKKLSNEREREQAMEELMRLKDPASVPFLIESLKTEGDHRADAAFLIGELGDKTAVAALVEGIDFAVGAGADKMSRAKNRANTKIAEALGKLGDPATVAPLVKLIKSRDQYVQLAAVRALGELKSVDAVDDLIKVAETHENNFMVKNAIIAMGDIGDPKAIDTLIWAMFFERGGVSFFRESSYALFLLGKPAVQPLIDTAAGKNERVNKMKLDGAVAPAKASVVLGDIGDPRGMDLIRKIAAEPDENTLLGTLAWSQAVRAIGLLGDKQSVATLRQQIFNIDVSQREFPTQALGLIGDRSVAEELLTAASHQPYWKDCTKSFEEEACKNSEWEVRQLSTEWLTRLADASMYDKVKAMIDGESDEKVKNMLNADLVRLEAARECQDKVACWLEKLKTQAADTSQKAKGQAARIRDKAAYELSYLKDPSTVPALLEALQDQDLETRFAVCVALLRLLPEKGADQVDKIVDDERGKATYIKVNEDLKRLAVKMRRRY